MRNKKFSAFSLLEMSFVILIIGILISGIMGGRALIYKSSVASARNLTKSSPVTSMKSGLVLWLDSVSQDSFKNIVINDNDKIDSWYDINPIVKKSIFLQQNAASQPKYRERGINNLPALEFDGLNDFMSCGAPFYDGLYPATTNNFSVFVVAQAIASHEIDAQSPSNTAGTSGEKYLFSPPHGTASYPNVPNVAGVGISFGNNGISIYEHAGGYMPPLLVYSPGSTAGKPAVSNPVVMLLEYNNKTPSLYVNKQLVKTGLTSTKDVAFFSNVVGGYSSYGVFKGYLGEFIVFNRTLSSDEKDNVTDYLKTKWRIN